jgi:hypothetical protein
MPTEFYPFKNRKTTGPGPKGRTNTEAKRWSCKCEKKDAHESICKCVGLRTKSGRPSKARKTVRINLDKKKKYGKLYRKWVKVVKAKQKRAASRKAAA